MQISMGEIMEQLISSLLKDSSGNVISPMSFITPVSIALISTLLLGMIYNFFNNRKTFLGDSFSLTLVFISLGTSTIFLSLQHSIALSLGLIGSLSIIRFRTPIKDTVEMAFILLTVAISLIAAIGNYLFIIYILFITFVFMFTSSKRSLRRMKGEEKLNGRIVINSSAQMSDENILKAIPFACTLESSMVNSEEKTTTCYFRDISLKELDLANKCIGDSIYTVSTYIS